MSAGDENGPPVGAIVAESVDENVSVAVASAVSSCWPPELQALVSTPILVPESVPVTVPAAKLKLSVSVEAKAFSEKL